jgi:transcriptional regulator with XRE-family HTH domain
MDNDSAAQQTALVSRDRVIDTIRPLLRNATVVSRRFTVEQIADQAGVHIRTVRSYMANDPGEVREPTLSNALSIACVLGTPAVNSILALIGYGGAKPLEEAEEAHPMVAAATALHHLSTIATAAADGRIDHIERPACQEAADTIIATLIPYSSAGEAA